MLVALLSSQKMVAGESIQARGATRIGGQTILARQVDFALRTGCERIICLTNDLTPELVELQHHTEKGGAVFHAIHSAINLSGLISMADDVVVIADGLAFDEELSAATIGPHRTIVTLPANPAVDLGFERLDQDRAWAGLMVIAGALVEKLTEMPNDVDVQSSLLRLALQSGTRCAALPDNCLADRHWSLVTSQEMGRNYENTWLSVHARIASLFAPTHWFADRAAIATVKNHPKVRLASLSGNWVAIGFLIGGGLAGYLGYAAGGLAFVFLAAFAARFAESLRRILDHKSAYRRDMFGFFIQAVLDIVLTGLCVMLSAADVRIHGAFAVAVLLGGLYLAALTKGGIWWQKWQATLEDRGVITLLLFAASFTDLFLTFIQASGLIFLLLIIFQHNRSKLISG